MLATLGLTREVLHEHFAAPLHLHEAAVCVLSSVIDAADTHRYFLGHDHRLITA